jgi:hypothetical protein
VQDCSEAEDNTDARDKFFMFVALVSPNVAFKAEFAFHLPGLQCLPLIQGRRLLRNSKLRSWEQLRTTLAACWLNCMLPCLLSRLVASKRPLESGSQQLRRRSKCRHVMLGMQKSRMPPLWRLLQWPDLLAMRTLVKTAREALAQIAQ